MGMSAGLSAGMYEVGAETMIKTPNYFRVQDSYLRLGMYLADSKYTLTTQPQLRFLPVSIDGIYYINDNAYFGGGVNYPLKISGGLSGAIGFQLFFGIELDANKNGKFFAESGFSELKPLNADSYRGSYAVFGYRYFITSAAEKPKSEKKLLSKAKPVAVLLKPATEEVAAKEESQESSQKIIVIKKMEEEKPEVTSYDIVIPGSKKTTVSKNVKSLYVVQVGIFSTKANAQRLKNQVNSKGIAVKVLQSGDSWGVFAGESNNRSTSVSVSKRLNSLGFESFVKDND